MPVRLGTERLTVEGLAWQLIEETVEPIDQVIVFCWG